MSMDIFKQKVTIGQWVYDYFLCIINPQEHESKHPDIRYEGKQKYVMYIC